MKTEKLTLNKETLRRLNDGDAKEVAGGVQEPTYVSKCIKCRTTECL